MNGVIMPTAIIDHVDEAQIPESWLKDFPRKSGEKYRIILQKESSVTHKDLIEALSSIQENAKKEGFDSLSEEEIINLVKEARKA